MNLPPSKNTGDRSHNMVAISSQWNSREIIKGKFNENLVMVRWLTHTENISRKIFSNGYVNVVLKLI